MHGLARSARLLAGGLLTLSAMTAPLRADGPLGFAIDPRPNPMRASMPPAAVAPASPVAAPAGPGATPPAATIPPGPPPTALLTPSHVQWEIIGRSQENRVIECAQFGSGEYQVLVVGALIGNEPEGSGVAEMLAENLARFPRRVENVTVTIVRDPNPDGHAHRSPGNSNGVIIDRNFLTSSWRQWSDGGSVNSGHQAESEAETRVITELVNDVKPHRVVILGTAKDQATVRFVGPADHLAQQVAIEARAKLVPSDPALASGSLATMTGTDRGIPTLVMSFVPRATADIIFSEHKSALMTAIGCGSPIGFAPVGATSDAVVMGPPFTRPMRPVGDCHDVEELDVTPITFDHLVHGRRTVPIVQPQSSRQLAAPRPTPQAAPQATSATPVTHSRAAGAESSQQRLERLPPVNVQRSDEPGASHDALPQAPIPTYPTTGLD